MDRNLRSNIPKVLNTSIYLDSQGKKKMPFQPIESLRENIKSAVKIEIKAVDNIEDLIAKAYDVTLKAI